MGDTAAAVGIGDETTSGVDPAAPWGTPSFGTGCLRCGKSDNEDKILLCEGCDAEFHIYCLQPPLLSVPEDDWYCGKL
jgi:hypothetical protein